VPTALEVIDQLNVNRKKYENAVVLITGASAGIGVETARAFASLGSIVYLANRDEKKTLPVIADIESSHPISKGKIHFIHLDLNSLNSVRKCAAEFLRQSKKLNILITNAGVMACPEGRTADGFETTFGVNHLAHFLLVQLLLPLLISSSASGFNSRVISLSSSGHAMSPIQFGDFNLEKQGYERWKAYGQSKTANIYLATEIERRYHNQGVRGLAVHPGAVNTELARHLNGAPMTAEELKALGMPPDLDLAKLFATFRTPAQGASTTVWAALNPDFERKAGYYLEDCSVAKPKEPNETVGQTGFAPWAYNTSDAKRLWEESLALVGLEAGEKTNN